mmetsp:Transcript_65283/g.153697  ORF Transcript_65283/g.153697 Transcript_65283/m.153697 type:complete len:88 (-) Transcript_65283:775-1038(-)
MCAGSSTLVDFCWKWLRQSGVARVIVVGFDLFKLCPRLPFAAGISRKMCVLQDASSRCMEDVSAPRSIPDLVLAAGTLGRFCEFANV